MSDTTEEAEVACDGSGGYRTATRPMQRQSDGGDRFRLLLAAQGAAMALIGIVLFVVGAFSPELYFVVSFLGLLALRIVMAPTDRLPTWWTRLNWVVRAGFVVFGYLVLRRLPELLP